ncbi:tetratricopeptide repeat protein [Spongorhabdus nitratireducens]
MTGSRIGFLLLLMTLTACSMTGGKQPGKGDDRQVAATGQTEEQQPQKYGSFEPDTMYDLLVAEMAGHRQRFDMALGNYLQQAHKTRDPGIAQRAYQIAVYVSARQAALDAAVLWADVAPENRVALQASAVELARAGRLQEAAARMNRVLELKGRTSFDFLAVNAAELTNDERQGLIDTFDEALKKHSGDASLLLGKAILLQQQGETQAALKLCNQLLRSNPGMPKAIVLKARLLSRMDQAEEALKLLAGSLEENPDNTRMRLLYARILISLERLPEAQKQFEKLVELSPYDGDMLMSLALITLENDLHEDAKRYFERLLVLRHRVSAAHYYLGRIAEAAESEAEAKAHYLKVGPGKELLPAYSALAEMLVKKGAYKEALKYVEEARMRYPAFGAQFFMIESEVLISQKQLAEAMSRLNDALERFPENINLLYNRAMLAEKLDNLSRLETDLRAILVLDEDNVPALNALGYTLADKTDRLEEAAKLVRRAYKLDSEDPAIIDSLGWIEYRLGNLEEALKYLQMAYDKYPDPEIAAHLGEVLWMRKQHGEAIEVWRKTLEQVPDSAIILQTVERLNAETLLKKATAAESHHAREKRSH